MVDVACPATADPDDVVAVGVVVVLAEDLAPDDADPLGGGGVYDLALTLPLALEPDPFARYSINMPPRSATIATETSCQVAHERRSLMPRLPLAGAPVDAPCTGGPVGKSHSATPAVVEEVCCGA